MALSEQYLEEEIHPIDIVEHIAEHHEWTFDRIADDQIAMAVEGQWKTYSITLAWSGFDETLKMVCSFEMEPPKDRMGELYETLNAINDQCWAGGFTYWKDQNLMIYRYGLVLAGGQVASPDQIDTMINVAILSAERFYPALQWQPGVVVRLKMRCKSPLQRPTVARNTSRTYPGGRASLTDGGLR